LEKKIVLETSSCADENLKNASLKYMQKAKKLIKKMRSRMRSMKNNTNLETANLKSAAELETAKIKADADKKIEFYKTNAVELVKRREALDKFGEDLSDEKIMDEDSYAKAKLEKENALLKASLANGVSIVGDKTPIGRSDAQITSLKKEINNKAFKKLN